MFTVRPYINRAFFCCRTCLDSERARCANLTEALKHERAIVESQEREVEEKNKMLRDISGKEEETIEKLKTAVLKGKQQLADSAAQLQHEKAFNMELQKELTENKGNFVSENG